MSDQHIILRRTTLNGVVIEEARFISTAPSRPQAEEIASIFEDDTRHNLKPLIGFVFYFYVRSYE
jgi:hypothetical protein